MTLTALVAVCSALALANGAPAPRTTANASVVGQDILVQGKPFFPVMAIDQCTAPEVAHASALGINLILNEDCPAATARRQLSMIEPHALAVLSVSGAHVQGSALAGWTYPDEPETNGWTPAKLRDTFMFQRGSPDGLLSFVTIGAGFFHSSYTKAAVTATTYGAFTHVADVAGFDLYPLGHCSADLSAVYNAQRAFVRIAGPMPTFQWIETGPIEPTYCGGFQMTPAQLRAEVWLAVAGGARGIGYFTHTFSPQPNAFDVRPALEQTIDQIDRTLRIVRPGLLGRTVLSGADSSSVKLVARRANGFVYVFAVNTQIAPVKVQMRVPALGNGPVEVLGEGRSDGVSGGNLVDTFQPLAVHIYVQRSG